MKELCDVNLHRVVINPAKAAEIWSLAQRLNLKRTLAKLRTAFSK